MYLRTRETLPLKVLFFLQYFARTNNKVASGTKTFIVQTPKLIPDDQIRRHDVIKEGRYESIVYGRAGLNQ